MFDAMQSGELDECLAFEKEAEHARAAQSSARKRRREEIEEAAFQWECEVAAKSAAAAQAPTKAAKPAEAVKPAEATKPAEASKPAEAAKVPTTDNPEKVDKAVQVACVQ